MGRRILVTGAKGFVGRHLTELLAKTFPDAELHGWTRPGSRARASAGDLRDEDHGRMLFWPVEVRNAITVREALVEIRPTEVYHLAGVANVATSWSSGTDPFDVNVVGTHNVLDTLRETSPAARVLVPGSSTVYAPSLQPLSEDDPVAPESPYALSKLVQEMLGFRTWRDDMQPVLLARAFNHLGPGQDLSFFAPSFAWQLARIERGLAPPVLKVGNLEAARDLTDVRDTVAAYVALVERGEPGVLYNVCSGRTWKIADVLASMLARCRVPVEVEVDRDRFRPHDNPTVLGSFARLKDATGWQPRIPLERTIADLLDDARLRVAGEVRHASDTRGTIPT